MLKESAKGMMGRRDVLRTTAAAFATASWPDGTLDAALQNTRTASKPSDLRITDLRVAVVARAPMTCPIIRIDTNQGISGFGEVRDGASKTYALILKSRLLGENPCNIDLIFRKIRQFGYHARQGGGVSGVEKRMGCRCTRCWAANSATGSDATLTPTAHAIPRCLPGA